MLYTGTITNGSESVNIHDRYERIAGAQISKERNAENRRTKSLGLTQAGWDLVEELAPVVYDALVDTCHSNEEAVRIHLQAAREVVARERGAAVFS